MQIKITMTCHYIAIRRICLKSKFLYLKGRKLTHAATQMDLEDVMLSEISQIQKDKCCMIPLV